ncbi:ATP synthase F0 subunit 6 [Coemansia reversa NRRL 1564]|uniref:ATP synthase subunit a n=1 Tax=Coemansia reversa (strain ATCC 12441 / NRRL 1564) TaxID=763665 RepID=A0A2G5B1F4_COERN|nr:ATP synthase F0 subunit 6 [Coemansia reversa NRRL 1564]|eukprot:PIA12839.1 ATP synthase F0 subunit 6 [Coemansia reversa NRRL 1564]
MCFYNPLEQFSINDYLLINTPFYNISITNSGFYIIISAILMYGILIISIKKNNIIGDRISILTESIYKSILALVRANIGKENEIYLSLILTLFYFILIINFVGLVPYGFSPTAHFALTLSLSIMLIIGLTIIGFEKYKLSYFSVLLPSGTPLGLVPLLVAIELLSYIARAFSLGIRLGANIKKSHILLNVISSLTLQIISINIIFAILSIIPIVFLVLLMGLEIAVAILQAYVWCVLTSIYIKDSIVLH